MNKLTEALYSILIALWVGGLFAVGYLAAPVLFDQLPDRTLAGNLAGKMFSVTAWVGLGAGAYLLLYLLTRRGWSAFKSGVFWIVLSMVALTAAGQFGIQPILAQLKADALPRAVMESALRDRFATWHGISSGLYLIQSLLGLWLVLWQERGKR
ncbi:DUF4149 domain-containing protein [Denitratisoma oestradiolicum]|uniref:TMEM205-like domain-containing protein n=1 Tax=Denitratisoma oestradiolicum TaxID=311182 RepID=A0A6S6XX97_9PROT|nr:DUF4149 domain-containing protein [Denitratisoma oestradiolicum]TWO79806.1 hypothetical protein CBW56_12870 [Denitratisoma oestradiolicum]CAB1369499.1 conserved membrane protein of unknown function [Denitratisoma oestradiolicum]